MRKLIVVVGLALAWLCGMASGPAAADDAEVRYVITNGGADVEGKAHVEYFPAGKHDGSAITWAHSGGSVQIPPGTYNVHLTFTDGAAHKEQWLDNQSFAGKVEKTFEVAVPITEVRYVITNGGADVEGKAEVAYFPAGKHDGPSVTWAHSGGAERMPEGTYNVHLTFTDGAANKEMWFDNQAFAGKVEKTVEVAVPITEVRYVITNGGADVEGKGEVTYFPAGKHDGPSVTWGHSGGKERMPEGTYNVHVTFIDGAANSDKWFDNQSFAGNVEKTVEVGVAMAEVRFVITNGGTDVEGNGEVAYLPAGNHDGPTITWARSGGSVRIQEGSYDVHLTFIDGTAKKELWFDNQSFAGNVEKTVEIGVALTEVRFVITNNGVDTGDKGEVGYFPAGHHDGPQVTWARSGGSVRMQEGSYDVHVTFGDGAAHREKWLDNQAFAGTVERTVEIGVSVAEVRYVITNSGADVEDKGEVAYFPAGKHDGPNIAWSRSTGSVRLPEGSYNVQVTFVQGLARKAIWLDNQAFADKVDKTVELGLTLAEPTVTVTRDGADAGNDADVTYFTPSTQHEIGTVRNGEAAVVIAGSYDIRARFNGGEGWLRATAISGKPALTIEVQPKKQPPPQAQATLTLAAPAATPEPVSPDTGDFPYLPPLPGSTPAGGKASMAPVYVQLPDAHQPELVANSSIIKSYRAPGGVSVAALLALYHDALLKAGWTIVAELHRVDANVTTHYGQNDRNIWAFIHMDNNGYSITMADATIVLSKLAADLSSNCHLALTGVLFDFDKSTLKPESDPVLQQVGAMMAKDATLRLEVQGHTDGIGSDAYNQPLSDARARSVVSWLAQHGIAAARLSARGYGKTRPIASNGTDEGRARNRRVEIANLSCKAKS
jgi:outer membrane protein OmpA-like peptidoglycan-associated protein